MTNTYHVTIDGGPRNPLPVEVKGYWEPTPNGGFHTEEVILTAGTKTYNLMDVLSSRVINHINAQVEDQHYG